MDVGNLISGSSAFPKSSLNIKKFTVHILLKSGLENFEHYFASVRWVQLCGSLSILWHCLSLGLGWKLTFSSPVATAAFSKFAGNIECRTFTASPFRVWNSSTGIPSPPLVLFVVMFLKAHLSSHSRMSGSRWVITPLWLSWLWRSFLYSSSVYSGEGNGTPLHYSCLENSMDGGAWGATVPTVANSQTRLSSFTSPSCPWDPLK